MNDDDDDDVEKKREKYQHITKSLCGDTTTTIA